MGGWQQWNLGIAERVTKLWGLFFRGVGGELAPGLGGKKEVGAEGEREHGILSSLHAQCRGAGLHLTT